MSSDKSPSAILERLNHLIDQKKAVNSSATDEEIHNIVDEIVKQTNLVYNSIANQYRDVRKSELHPTDIYLFDKLLNIARELVSQKRLGDSSGILSLLDVGTGPGRDLLYFSKFEDIKPVGIDNSDSFISILTDLSQKGLIEKNSFFKMDMRNLSFFEDRKFDIVRHNATLLHLPLISSGVGADQAIAESRRVLVKDGLLFINVKSGKGMEFHDTNEGLGGRFFQYYTKDSLNTLLTRNDLSVLDIEDWHEERPSGTVNWLAVYAQKLTK